jgi:hypothetical protein
MSAAKKRQLLVNLSTAVISVVVLTLVTELILTFLVPLVFRPRFTRLDHHVGWYHSASVSEIDETEGHRHRVSYNANGYRSPERAYAKPAGRQRVVVLGDSFVDGSEVGDDELFTWKMEQALGDVDVINLGVYGYQTAQQLVTLEREGLRYSPDAVVLITVPNDLPGNVVGLESFGPAPRFVLDGDSLAFEDLDHPNAREAFRVANLPAPRWVHHHSTLYYFLNSYIYQRLVADRITEFRNTRLASLSPDDQKELYRRIVLRIRDICNANRIPLMVVFTHQRHDVLNSKTSQFADLGESLRTSGVTVVDLFEQLREQEMSGQSPFYRGDPHWNSLGHEKVAEWLASPVRTLLGKPSATASPSVRLSTVSGTIVFRGADKRHPARRVRASSKRAEAKIVSPSNTSF